MNNKKRSFLFKILSTVIFMTFMMATMVFAQPTNLIFSDLNHGDKNDQKQGYVWYTESTDETTVKKLDFDKNSDNNKATYNAGTEIISDWANDNGGTVMFWKPLQDNTIDVGDKSNNDSYNKNYVIWDSFPVTNTYINDKVPNERNYIKKFKLFNDTYPGDTKVNEFDSKFVPESANIADVYLSPSWGNLNRHPVIASEIVEATLSCGKIMIKGNVINNTPFEVPFTAVKIKINDEEKVITIGKGVKGFEIFNDPSRMSEFSLEIDASEIDATGSYSITGISTEVNFKGTKLQEAYGTTRAFPYVRINKEGTNRNYKDYSSSGFDMPITPVKLTDELSITKRVLNKTGNPVEVAPGDEVEFEYKIENTGQTAINNIDVADEDIIFEGVSTPINLESGKSITLKGKYKVPDSSTDGTVLVRPVSCTGTSDCGGEKVTADDSVNLLVKEIPSMKVEKTANPTNFKPGDTVEYTIVVENTGKAALVDVRLEDVMDPNLPKTISKASSDLGYTINGNTISVGDLGLGESKTITYTVTIPEDSTAKEYKNEITNISVKDSGGKELEDILTDDSSLDAVIKAEEKTDDTTSNITSDTTSNITSDTTSNTTNTTTGPVYSPYPYPPIDNTSDPYVYEDLTTSVPNNTIANSVVDNTQAVINDKIEDAIIEAEDITLEVGESFDIMDEVAAIDDAGDGDIITDIVRASGKINTQVPGKYTVTYSVVGENGVLVTKKVTITVVEPAKETVKQNSTTQSNSTQSISKTQTGARKCNPNDTTSPCYNATSTTTNTTTSTGGARKCNPNDPSSGCY